MSQLNDICRKGFLYFYTSAVNVALLQRGIPGDDPRRRIFVILTDGSTQDSMQAVTTTASKLQR